MEIDRKRPRSWYRPRNVALALTALLLAWLGREIYLAVTAVPGPRVDYFARLGALVEAHQPAGEDAWPVLMTAADLEFSSRADVFGDDPAWAGVPLDYSIIGGPRRPWSDGSLTYDGRHTWEQVETKAIEGMRLLRERGVPDLLARAAAMPRAVRVLARPPSGHIVDVMLPELSRLRQMARYNRARMTIAGRAGDDAEFVAAFEQTLAIARFTAAQGLLIDYFVGVAIHAVATYELGIQMCERALSEDTLRGVRDALERHPLPPLAVAIEGERISTLDTIQWTHTDNGRGGGRLILSAVYGNGTLMGGGTPRGVLGTLSETPLINLGGLAFADRRETTARASEFYDGLVRGASGGGASAFDPDAFEKKLSRRFMLLKMILPSMSAAYRSHDHTAKLAGTRLMLEIELHRATTGDYPVSVADLNVSPGLLTDPSNQRPFVYRRLEPGEDRHGRRYLLYGLGADLTDDMGRTKGWMPQAALRSVGRGFDFVINMPREDGSDGVDPVESDEP